jgi:hypothetical protein
MAVAMAKETWTDERLDDLEIAATRRRVKQVFAVGYVLMLLGFAGTIVTAATQL